MNMNYSSFKTALLFKRRQNCTKKFAHYYQNFKSVITVMAVTVHIGVDHASFNCIRHVAPTCTPSNSISTGSAIFAALTVVINRQTGCLRLLEILQISWYFVDVPGKNL